MRLRFLLTLFVLATATSVYLNSSPLALSEVEWVRAGSLLFEAQNPEALLETIIDADGDLVSLAQTLYDIKPTLSEQELAQADELLRLISIRLGTRAPRIGATPEEKPLYANPIYHQARDEYLRTLVVTGSLIAPNSSTSSSTTCSCSITSLPLSGDVIGQTNANHVAFVCGVPACNLVNTYSFVLTATSADIPNTLVERDNTGSFFATNVTLTGQLNLQAQNGNTAALRASSASSNYALNLPANTGTSGYALVTDGNNPANLTWQNVTTYTIQLYGDVTGSSTATHVAFVCGVPACNLINTYSFVLTATSADIPNTLVLRDNTGSFAATTITLTGNALINYSSVGTIATGSGYVWAPKNFNSFIGLLAGNENSALVTGSCNIALGYSALATVTGGFNNIAIGAFAGQSLQGEMIAGRGVSYYGTDNIALGAHALASSQAGIRNIAIGTSALQNAVDIPAGHDRVFVADSIAIGYQALMNMSPIDAGQSLINMAIGNYALTANTTGYYNTAIGNATLSNCTSGYYNTAVGHYALAGFSGPASGHNNTAVGFLALQNNMSGLYNTALGSGAGGNIIVGDNNIYLGYAVAAVADESNTIRIGSTTSGLPTASCFIQGIYE